MASHRTPALRGRWASKGASERGAEATFSGHTDWVNDVVMLSPETVASCSNDSTIRLWDARSGGIQLYTMHQHTDYVMALAAAPRQGLLASAGLSSEVFVWDIPTGLQLLKQASSGMRFRHHTPVRGQP